MKFLLSFLVTRLRGSLARLVLRALTRLLAGAVAARMRPTPAKNRKQRQRSAETQTIDGEYRRLQDERR